MQHDLAAPERWLESQRRSRRRRLAAARAAARRRLGRRGVVALVAAMTVATAGATAAQTASPTTKTTLKRGMTGSSVAALQRALGIPADGIFGPQTRRAVRRFQRSKGLVVDGIAGPATLSALGITVRRAPRAAKRSAPNAVLARIAACESGGDPTAVSADGRYRGKYQFSRATWRSVGGTGDPAAAPEAEQDRLAALLYEREGTRPWPACGRRA